MSTGIVSLLPYVLNPLARNLPASRAFIENEEIFLAAIEITAAVGLILFFNFLRRFLQDRKLAWSAKRAGLVAAVPARGLFQRQQKKLKGMKDRQGSAREIMIIGSTGYRSFALPEGDLYEAVRNCREAKIMLLDPREHGAIARAQSIPDPEISPEVIREQIMKSIEFMKGLRGLRKSVRLKLYPDMPLLKLAILGDYAYVRHYHTGLNVRSMPEFVFRNIQHDGGLYLPMYRYFVSRWQDPDMPEYDLDTDELVYHDQLGYEVLREPFDGITITDDEHQRNEKETEAERSYFR